MHRGADGCFEFLFATIAAVPDRSYWWLWFLFCSAFSKKQDDGYMVALLFNEKTQESTFAVYDATQLRRSAGPSVGVGYSSNIGALIIAHTILGYP